MLTIDQFRHRDTGAPLRGFHVRNASGKIIATGAAGVFVAMRHDRYAHDRDMVAKIGRLTGLKVRV